MNQSIQESFKKLINNKEYEYLNKENLQKNISLKFFEQSIQTKYIHRQPQTTKLKSDKLIETNKFDSMVAFGFDIEDNSKRDYLLNLIQKQRKNKPLLNMIKLLQLLKRDFKKQDLKYKDDVIRTDDYKNDFYTIESIRIKNNFPLITKLNYLHQDAQQTNHQAFTNRDLNLSLFFNRNISGININKLEQNLTKSRLIDDIEIQSTDASSSKNENNEEKISIESDIKLTKEIQLNFNLLKDQSLFSKNEFLCKLKQFVTILFENVQEVPAELVDKNNSISQYLIENMAIVKEFRQIFYQLKHMLVCLDETSEQISSKQINNSVIYYHISKITNFKHIQRKQINNMQNEISEINKMKNLKLLFSEQQKIIKKYKTKITNLYNFGKNLNDIISNSDEIEILDKVSYQLQNTQQNIQISSCNDNQLKDYVLLALRVFYTSLTEISIGSNEFDCNLYFINSNTSKNSNYTQQIDFDSSQLNYTYISIPLQKPSRIFSRYFESVYQTNLQKQILKKLDYSYYYQSELRYFDCQKLVEQLFIEVKTNFEQFSMKIKEFIKISLEKDFDIIDSMISEKTMRDVVQINRYVDEQNRIISSIKFDISKRNNDYDQRKREQLFDLSSQIQQNINEDQNTNISQQIQDIEQINTFIQKNNFTIKQINDQFYDKFGIFVDEQSNKVTKEQIQSLLDQNDVYQYKISKINQVIITKKDKQENKLINVTKNEINDNNIPIENIEYFKPIKSKNQEYLNSILSKFKKIHSTFDINSYGCIELNDYYNKITSQIHYQQETKLSLYLKFQLDLDNLILSPIDKLFLLHMEIDSLQDIIFQNTSQANEENFLIYKIRIEDDCKLFLNSDDQTQLGFKLSNDTMLLHLNPDSMLIFDQITIPFHWNHQEVQEFMVRYIFDSRTINNINELLCIMLKLNQALKQVKSLWMYLFKEQKHADRIVSYIQSLLSNFLFNQNTFFVLNLNGILTQFKTSVKESMTILQYEQAVHKLNIMVEELIQFNHVSLVNEIFNQTPEIKNEIEGLKWKWQDDQSSAMQSLKERQTIVQDIILKMQKRNQEMGSVYNDIRDCLDMNQQWNDLIVQKFRDGQFD